MSSSLTDSLRPENLLRSGYKDCVLCEVLRPGEEERCRDCSGRQGQRDRLLWEIRRERIRKTAGILSLVYPGLGHLYSGRISYGVFWAALLPLEPRSRPQRLVRDHLRPRLPADRGGRDLVDGVCRRTARPPRTGGSVRERLPGPHPCSGLHRPRAGGAAARGAGAGARQAPFRGVLRARLPPSVRAGVRAQRVRGADLHHGDQAVRRGPRVRGGDPPVFRGKRSGSRAQGGDRRRRRVRIVGRRHARAARRASHGVRCVRGTRRDDAVRRGGVPVSRGCAPGGRDADPRPGSALPGRDPLRQGRDVLFPRGGRIRRRPDRRGSARTVAAVLPREGRSRVSTTLFRSSCAFGNIGSRGSAGGWS